MKRKSLAGAMAWCMCAVIAMMFAPGAALGAEADLAAGDAAITTQADVLASGTCGTCDWFVEADGKLVIQPSDGVSGVLPSNDNREDRFFPWKSAQAYIKSAEIRKGVSLVGSAAYMFGGSMGGIALTSVDLSGFDTSKVTDMYGLFFSCFRLESVDFSGVDTSSVTSMYGMFRACSSLASLDLSGFDTSNVTDMGLMFWRCRSLKSLDVGNFNTSKVTNMIGMFQECTAESINVSGFDTSNVTNMFCMFCLCQNLKTLDLSSFDTSKVTDMGGMFSGMSELTTGSLETVYVSDSWTTESLTDKGASMFGSCTAIVGGNGTAYDEAHVDAEYARIDAEGAPGYFTKRSSILSYAGAAAAEGFSDLKAEDWYMNAHGGAFPGTKTLYLDYTIKRGFMSGFSGDRAGQFGPNERLTRGMAATIIYRMATGATADTTDNKVATRFSDVPRGAWFAAAVKWCADNGVVTGYTGTDRFGPEDPITREQLATIIGRYMDKGGEAGDDVSQFRDADKISGYAKAGIAYCNANGIMSGIGTTGDFDPWGEASRCQMAKVIAVTARMAE